MSNRRSEGMMSSLVRRINDATQELVSIWDRIGIMEEMRVERMETAQKHIEDLVNGMVKEEREMEQRLQLNIDLFQQQMVALCQELDKEPYQVGEGLTVLQKEKDLRVCVQALTNEKEQRLRELRSLQEQDMELCDELCDTPYYVPTGTTPSHSQLQQLRKHVSDLALEKSKRAGMVRALREEIRRMMEEMGHEPESTLERESISNDQEIFQLTNNNITTLNTLVSRLEGKKQCLVESMNELKDKAVCLWNRLDCAESDRTAFQESLHGTLADKITQWQNEVERLSEQQRLRLGEVVGKVRQELLALWDLCTYSIQQREAFNMYFYEVDYTEELLSHHDAELLRVKAYYDQARPLLELLQKWEKNWVLHQDFERKSNDPSRFSNRGGALLKEAKEKDRVRKMLPKLEEELKSGAELWRRNMGCDFLVRGQKVMCYISHEREVYQQQKEKEKIERQQQLPAPKGNNSAMFKTPTKRSHGGLTGPSPCKMKKSTSAVLTPSAPVHSTFVRSHSTSSNSSTGSSGNHSGSISGSSSKPPLQVKVKTRPVEGSANSVRTPLQVHNRDQRTCDAISYTDFASELRRDAVLNSTVKDLI